MQLFKEFGKIERPVTQRKEPGLGATRFSITLPALLLFKFNMMLLKENIR
jgi:hypothetical protein